MKQKLPETPLEILAEVSKRLGVEVTQAQALELFDRLLSGREKFDREAIEFCAGLKWSVDDWRRAVAAGETEYSRADWLKSKLMESKAFPTVNFWIR